eukprot:CAMPEP_0178403608 /NCGR_PEP_ID=MMETSP0689_2-20121128/17456_1 /TAXON_ID=160604 /ORGANISM="Amphidinium massartii, Strain CS-259" /LENGTH=194 /DNA_ID=CAMNT_0020024567 /DNA_START=73 /DNA_END=657 /DNA_ORIENTATION=+
MARSKMVMAAVLALTCLAGSNAFVAGPTGKVDARMQMPSQLSNERAEMAQESERAGSQTAAAVAMSVAVGALAGFVRSRRQQAASAAAAAVVGVTGVAANAMVDYSGLAYLGGSDKVDINNANVQAYRQFPGMYPTIAGLIGSNGPYKSVADIYNIKGLTEPMKSVLKQYEANFVCFPADPAYFIDRVNNGLYR